MRVLLIYMFLIHLVGSLVKGNNHYQYGQQLYRNVPETGNEIKLDIRFYLKTTDSSQISLK